MVISGSESGSDNAGQSVEVYVPSTGQSCELPDLPGNDEYDRHIMEGLMVCGGQFVLEDSCLTLKDGTWDTTTASLQEDR